MSAPGERRAIDVGGRSVLLSNERKVIYPATGFTKGDLVRYYLAVAPFLLPHLGGRPVTLARFPDGVDAPGWYQTNCPGGRPDWLAVARIRGARGQLLRYCRIEEPAALAWAANTGAIELHPLLADPAGPDTASALILDLDPVPPAEPGACARVALRARELLAADGLAPCPKTSGGRGLHLYAPLDGSDGFARAKGYARALAAALVSEDPSAVADRLAREGRAGKVLVDWRQNDANRSMIAPYSLRAATTPVVSTPLAWEEVAEAARERRAAGRLRFGPEDVIERLARLGDLFAPVLRGDRRLGELRR